MILDQVYKRRFENTEMRNQLWGILVRSFFQKYVDPNDIVLDVPSGYGEFINQVNCKKKYALDINPDAKKHVKKGVSFLLASSTKIPLPKNSVDKIFVSNFFEHLTHQDIEKTIREFKRILKTGGRVMVLQPNIRFAYKNYWMFFDHITPVDDRALEEIFSIIGFTPKEKILRFLPFTTKSKLPVKAVFVRLYLHIPFLWRVFGKQSFLIFENEK